MAYTLNNFNGTVFKVLQDGTVDRQYTSSLNLIGRLVSGYGELQNENFLWLLQNFAGTLEPTNKVQGQIWFDSSSNVLQLKVYDGSKWQALPATQKSVNPPESVDGALWIKTSTRQLFLGTGTGTSWSLVGPEAVEGFAETGMKAVKVLDTTNDPHLVLKLMMNGKAVGVVSTSTFNVKTNEDIYQDGWTNIADGINLRAVKADSISATNVTSTGITASTASITLATFNSVNSVIGNISSLTGNSANITKVTTPLISSGSTATNAEIEGQWTLTAGSRLVSTYADLAENYMADDTYSPGQVMKFGGNNEVTLADKDMDTAVAGIITTNPAYLMNGAWDNFSYVVSIALSGRVPCYVQGPVKKGDLLVSGAGGFARAEKNPKVGTIIGTALADYNASDIGNIEVFVWRG